MNSEVDNIADPCQILCPVCGEVLDIKPADIINLCTGGTFMCGNTRDMFPIPDGFGGDQ